MIHDWQHHEKFHCIYDQIFSSLFLQHFIKQLKTYILHCLKCKINQTKHYNSYSFLQLITTFLILFYTIIMNFILILLLNFFLYQYNNIFTVINKFTKQILLLSNRSIYTAADWINVLLLDFIEHDWSIFHQIINNWDQKFLSFFWHTIFECLNIKLLTFTAYYSQTDDQFKHTNQTVKIVLQYALFNSDRSDEAFITILLYLQDSLNNARNIFIHYILNELTYEFCTNDSLNTLLFLNLFFKDYNHLQQIYHKDAEHIIIFANVMSKHYYDAKHTFLAINEMIYLQLFHRYIISDLANQKLSNQHIRLFQVIEWIENLVYHLNLSFTMQIHSVISIAQLKFTLHEFDFYNHQLKMNSLSVENNIIFKNNNIKSAPFYKIEHLLDKWIWWIHDKSVIEYLIKWKKYNHSHNAWYEVKNLTNAKKLVKNYKQWQQ